ncbi:dehydrogenase [Enterococcus florum]|uniref:Dehydrogenase n=1 Tax=Enterococcus florum TaxID=2480627 RepID=A0A4P5PBL9_9ENTE|nr:Gfo/Idh/MocA family oxidoreductase [Enterococcus florum]GCF93681.1 dehydrogenase [Enterococcus florum]
MTIAIIGAGFAGNFHTNSYDKVTGVDLRIKYVYDNDQERAKKLCEKWDIIEQTAQSYEEVLNDPEVDIITPPVTHLTLAYQALKTKKHVICEKPLTDYFGEIEDQEPIGLNVPKSKMYKKLLADINECRQKFEDSDRLFMYAENYVYSPNILQSAKMIEAKKSKIMYMKGEESIRSSTSPASAHWSLAGGGSLIRLDSHPIGGMLFLKQIEANARGEKIRVQSVVAETGRLAPTLNAHDKRYFPAESIDTEDFATVILTFTDGTKAISISNDNTLGGVKNYVEVYTNDSVLVNKITPADNLSTYFLDQEDLDDVYISEQLQDKTGWNKVFVAEETLRGYLAQYQDFAECVAENREPLSGLDLAYDTIKIIYAAYLSAEEGRRVDF